MTSKRSGTGARRGRSWSENQSGGKVDLRESSSIDRADCVCYGCLR